MKIKYSIKPLNQRGENILLESAKDPGHGIPFNLHLNTKMFGRGDVITYDVNGINIYVQDSPIQVGMNDYVYTVKAMTNVMNKISDSYLLPGTKLYQVR